MESSKSNQENPLIRTVQEFLRLQYEGKIEEAFSNYALKEFKWVVSSSENEELNKAIPWAGKNFRGKKGYENLVNQLFGEFTANEFDVKQFYATEDKVFAIGHFNFTHKITNKIADSDFIGLFEMKEGKISGGQFYENTYAVAKARV